MGKRGPKHIEINWEEFDKLCSIQCTLREIAAWFQCSEDTIERAVLREHGVKFAEHYGKKASVGTMSLRRKQWEMALKGDKTMLIWLGKQHLGQSEKIEQSIDSNEALEITVRHGEDLIVGQADQPQLSRLDPPAAADSGVKEEV